MDKQLQVLNPMEHSVSAINHMMDKNTRESIDETFGNSMQDAMMDTKPIELHIATVTINQP